MKRYLAITIMNLAGLLAITPVFAFCILGIGNTCKVQDITNTNHTNIGNVSASTQNNVKQGDVTNAIGATTQTVNADTIRQFIGSQDANQLFLPLTSAATQQLEFQKQTVSDLKSFVTQLVKDNQAFQVAQAKANQDFVKQVVQQVTTSPPTIPIVSASSSFPISFPTNSITTPIYFKDVDSINNFNNLSNKLNNNMSFNPGGASSSLTSPTITQAAHGFAVGDAIYYTGTVYALASAAGPGTSEVLGVVSAATTNTFSYVSSGVITGLAGLTSGSVYYLSTVGTTGNTLTLTEPTAVSSVSKPVGFATSATTMQVEILRGTPAQGQTAVVQSGVFNLASNQTLTTPTVFTAVPTMTMTLPVAGTYRIGFSAPFLLTTANSQPSFRLFNSTASSAIAETQKSSQINLTTITEQSGETMVTITQATTIILQASTPTGNITVYGADASFGTANIYYQQIGAAPVPMSFAGEYVGPIYPATASVQPTAAQTSSANPAGYMTLTIPTAGIWDITYGVRSQVGQITGVNTTGIQFALYDNTNTLVANSEVMSSQVNPANGTTNLAIQSTGTGNIVVTTTGSATYKVQVWNQSGNTSASTQSDANGRSFMYAHKISGFIPVTGQTVDYAGVELTPTAVSSNLYSLPQVNSGNLTTLAGVTSKLQLTGSTVTGNLTVDTVSAGAGTATNYTITISKTGTYDVEAIAQISNTSAANNTWLQIVKNGTTVLAAKGGRADAANATMQVTSIWAGSLNSGDTLDFRLGTNVASGVTGISGHSIKVKQLGSSAAIVNPGWNSYTPTITAITTAPTLATTNTFTAAYQVVGKTMYITWLYRAATAAGSTAGSGAYKFPIPAGYTINTTIATLPSSISSSVGDHSGEDAQTLGTGQYSQSGNSDDFGVVAVTSTELGACMNTSPSLMGSSYHPLNVAQEGIRFTATIPIN